jgi:tRNA (guanine-N7-)-methyltransferase
MRIRQHVNPLRSQFLEIDINPLEVPFDQPLEVELGSADCQFLMERVSEDPHRFYLGIEIRQDLVLQSNRIVQELGMTNVKSIFANISVDLPKVFSPGRVNRFFINFPDPWFKNKQHKRRIICSDLFDQLFCYLSEEGEIHIATDIFDIALEAMSLLESESPRRFHSLHVPWSFLPKSFFSARSRREKLCEAESIRVWRLAYRKNS